MLIQKYCCFTGKNEYAELPITEQQFERYCKNANLSLTMIFPQLNADQREFLVSGIPPGRWDEFMLPEDEDLKGH
jgi:hypothetical protein